MNSSLIKKPHITEKNTLISQNNEYTFIVDKNANKSEIKKEIERLYKVKVLRVNILNNKGKFKRFGNVFSKKGSYKKAIIKIKEGQKIEF
jgi:large subunit ribosomal protein L23